MKSGNQFVETFWGHGESSNGQFLLGDFAKLARFFALTQAEEFKLMPYESNAHSNGNNVEEINVLKAVSEDAYGTNEA